MVSTCVYDGTAETCNQCRDSTFCSMQAPGAAGPESTLFGLGFWVALGLGLVLAVVLGPELCR